MGLIAAYYANNYEPEPDYCIQYRDESGPISVFRFSTEDERNFVGEFVGAVFCLPIRSEEHRARAIRAGGLIDFTGNGTYSQVQIHRVASNCDTLPLTRLIQTELEKQQPDIWYNITAKSDAGRTLHVTAYHRKPDGSITLSFEVTSETSRKFMESELIARGIANSLINNRMRKLAWIDSKSDA